MIYWKIGNWFSDILVYISKDLCLYGKIEATWRSHSRTYFGRGMIWIKWAYATQLAWHIVSCLEQLSDLHQHNQLNSLTRLHTPPAMRRYRYIMIYTYNTVYIYIDISSIRWFFISVNQFFFTGLPRTPFFDEMQITFVHVASLLGHEMNLGRGPWTHQATFWYPTGEAFDTHQGELSSLVPISWYLAEIAVPWVLLEKTPDFVPGYTTWNQHGFPPKNYEISKGGM